MNLITIMLDSLRPDFVGCYGMNEVVTPAMDRLASEGTFFRNAYAEAPTTIPARTALFCGIYTFTNRPWMKLRPEDAHLAEWLKEHGFRTAAFGDGPFHWGVPGHQIQRGFDICESFFGKCSPPPPEYEGLKLDMSGIHFPPGCSKFDRHIQEISMRSRRYSRDKTGKVSVENITDRAIEFLERVGEAKFFLWLDYFEIHEPWDTPKEFTDLYGLDERGRFVPMPPHHWPEAREADLRILMAHYKGCITQNDRQIGRIVNKLDELGLAEDTLLVVISDHGEPFGEHGTFRKFLCPVYDELAKIVWIMRGPGVEARGGVDALASNVDYAPTVSELLGVPRHEKFEGMSLAPVLSGDKERVRDEACIGAFQTRRGIRTDRWKYIDNMGEKPAELFDMESDPQEKDNMAEKEKDLAGKLARDLWKFGKNWANALAWRDHPRE